MGFQQGLSGLNMSAKGLDAIGNNIANSQTVGFKAATTQFNDVYAAAVGGASTRNQVGQGGGVMAVAQVFTQGNVTSTNNPLDLAINGNGFLRFQPSLTDQTAEYSRNGQLHLDADGYIVNAQDRILNAFPSPDGESIDQSSAGPLQLDSGQLEPRATGFSNTLIPGSGGIGLGINLDVRDKRMANPGLGPVQEGWTSLQDWSFATLNPNMYNYSTSATIYDQRGEPHVLTMYFVRQPGLDLTTGNTVGSTNWQPHVVLDNQYEITGLSNNGAAPTFPPTIDFDPNGQLNKNANGSIWTLDVAGLVNGPVVDRAGVPIDLTLSPPGLFPDAATEPLYSLTIDFDSATQYGSAYDVNALTQDGYGPGRLAGVAIDPDGKILARYTNGKSKLMGQIAMVTFQNPSGLVPQGNNMWAESAASGQPLLGAPGTGSRGVVQSGAVEDANVDLTAELVNMITMQRAYQANAQTIKTQDQVLQTLVNLR
jgi:flagellar hook protein FlgE